MALDIKKILENPEDREERLRKIRSQRKDLYPGTNVVVTYVNNSQVYSKQSDLENVLRNQFVFNDGSKIKKLSRKKNF